MAASSASPAMAVMAPMPETAPRTKGLDAAWATHGTAPAKKLLSQNPDHGATMRTSPASRK